MQHFVEEHFACLVRSVLRTQQDRLLTLTKLAVERPAAIDGCGVDASLVENDGDRQITNNDARGT